jgi:hypothetical protein
VKKEKRSEEGGGGLERETTDLGGKMTERLEASLEDPFGKTSGFDSKN